MTRHIHVEAINRVALSASSPELLQEWFPDGKALKTAFRAGGDGGAILVSTETGAWHDTAVGAKGEGLVALFAHVIDMELAEEAQLLAARLDLEPPMAMDAARRMFHAWGSFKSDVSD